VTDFDGEPNYLDRGNIVCGAPKVFVPLLEVVQKAHKGALKPA
jgi:myo-inositol-1(or 4)-monophosphatase